MKRFTKDLEERRQEILDTAISIFSIKGYEKTTITDIAKKMNVSQGLCYRYFASKEEVFDMALDYYAQVIVDGMRNELNDKNKKLDEIIYEMPNFLEIEKKNSSYYKLFHEKGSRKIHDELSNIVCKKLIPIVQEMLVKSNENGETHIPDVETAASFFVYGQQGVLNRTDLTNKEKAERIRSFLKTMIK